MSQNVKRGRPAKEKTFIKTMRVNADINEFLSSLENANDFLIFCITEKQEYKDFIAKKRANDNQPFLDF